MQGVLRIVVWLLLIALAFTLLLCLIEFPVERTEVDVTATPSDSDYVTAYGLPRFFLVTDESVKHPPGALSLVGNFFFDLGFWFAFFLGIFSGGVLGIVVIARLARFAARVVLQFRR